VRSPATAPTTFDERPRPGLAARFDRGSLVGIALGVALVMQPWWEGGFRAGFFVVLVATLVQIVASHLVPKERA
jgi:hypothetical protein